MLWKNTRFTISRDSMAFSDMTLLKSHCVKCGAHECLPRKTYHFFARFISRTMMKAVKLKRHLFTMRSFGLIRIRVNSESMIQYRPLGSWCIIEVDESLPAEDAPRSD